MRKTFKSILALASTGIALVVLAFTTAVPANAITSSERHDIIADKIADQQSELIQSLEVLKSKPQEEWVPAEIQLYLSNAMWAVHYGILQYKYDHDRLPESIDSLVGTDYIPVWPENPFKNFTSMQVLDGFDGFQAGELVLLICPPEEYSRIKDPRPLSYEIGVYGPDTDFARYGDASADLNGDWVVVPVGVLYMVGAREESAKHLEEKYERIKKEREATKEEGASDGTSK
jgi:hypothetical protein